MNKNNSTILAGLIFAWLSILLVPARAAAHPLNLAYLTIDVSDDGRAQITLRLPTGTELTAAAVLESTTLADANGLCRVLSRTPQSVELQCTASAVANMHLTIPALRENAAAFSLLGRARYRGQEQVFNLDLEHIDFDIRWIVAPSFVRFLMIGVRHIGAWPSEWHDQSGLHLPSGIDHILFLVALLLGGGSLRRTLAMVTGFTLGHSITLALAAFGWAHAPTRLVESAIALSIVYVALEDLLSARPRHRWQVATLFGLVHGLAFASALTELHLQRGDMAKALVGFNLGVELGQASLVLILTLLAWAIRRVVRPSPLRQRRTVQVLALGIAGLATYWFIQRAFF